MDMRIDRESRELENVAHDDACRFVSDSGEAFEFFEGVGDFALEFVDEGLRKLENIHAFGVEKSARLDDFGNAFHAELDHFLRGVGELEKNGGHLVHADVCALGAQHDRDKHREGVRVI